MNEFKMADVCEILEAAEWVRRWPRENVFEDDHGNVAHMSIVGEDDFEVMLECQANRIVESFHLDPDSPAERIASVIIAATNHGEPDVAHGPTLTWEDHDYLARVGDAVAAGNRDVINALSDICTECGEHRPHDDVHQTIGSNVIIGCEGYWLVDPALVGIRGRNWEPVAAQDTQVCRFVGGEWIPAHLLGGAR
jgi:hypothetical protein